MDGLTVAESGNAALSLAMSCSTWAGLSITSDPRSGSRRGLSDLAGFPGPGQEFVQALGWVIGQPLQNVGQPRVWVNELAVVRLPLPSRGVAGIDLCKEEARRRIDAEHDFGTLRLP